MKYYTCMICQGNLGKPVFSKRELALARCVQCGFVQQHPVPDMESLTQEYRDEAGYKNTILQTEQVYRDRDRAVLLELAKLGAKGPLLDVGASVGVLLREAKAMGWEVEGLEISHPSAEYIRKTLGIPVYETTLEKADIPLNRFGIVIFSNSLEHVHNPLDTLKHTAALLKPGGWIHIAVPNWKAAKRILIGKHISWIYPHHVSYFSRNTLELALKKAGFQPLVWRYNPFIGKDYRFFIGLMRRLRFEPAICSFLNMRGQPLDSLVSDNIRLKCPTWRFRFVVCLAEIFIKVWPEKLFCVIGRGEELRVSAVLLDR